MTTTNSSFTALPDDVLQRVLLGVALDDHDATAAALSAFAGRLGPRFLRLRREHESFAERRVIIVGQDATTMRILEIFVAGIHGAASVPEGLDPRRLDDRRWCPAVCQHHATLWTASGCGSGCICSPMVVSQLCH